ncbi:MAG: YiiX/YebB-like N1pC/P60 family cysteine hydrolase, partial [Candidatus Geothermincolales bacterium]
WGEPYRDEGHFRWEGIAPAGAGLGAPGAETLAAIKALEGELQPGDILLGRCELSPVPSLSPWNNWTHAALYCGRGEVVAASNPLDDVERGSLAGWVPPNMTWVVFLRVRTDEDTRKRAVQWALEKVGKQYSANWVSKGVDKESWYCSEFIWAAYMAASNGSLDLEEGPDVLAVSPKEIYSSPLVDILGGIYRRKPETMQSMFMKVLLLCALLGSFGSMVVRPQGGGFAGMPGEGDGKGGGEEGNGS